VQDAGRARRARSRSVAMNPVEDLVSNLMSLGGRPAGDASAMMAEADKLNALADRLGTALALLKPQATIVYYEGPQAVTHQQAVDDHAAALGAIINDMRQRARTVYDAAGGIARDQVAWDQRLNRRVTGLPSEIVNSAKRRLGLD
jgi:hypothetical protein